MDTRLLAPWSSWEDALNQIDPTAPEQTVTVIPEPRGPAIVALPVQPEPVQPPQAARIDAPARAEVLLEFLKTITPKDLGGKE